MGGSAGKAPDTDINDIYLRQELSALRDPNSQQNQLISQLMSGKLSDPEANAYAMQLKSVDSGIAQARQAAQQTAREGASARGLFSSDIALGAEGAALGDIENQYAMNRANLYGNIAGQIKSGILSGLQSSQNVYQQRQELARNIANASYQSNSLAQQAYGTQLQYQPSMLGQAGSMLGALGGLGAASTGSSAIAAGGTGAFSAGSGILGALTMFSDKSLKENIEPLDTMLEKIDMLNPVSFEWKEDGRKDIGVIAQEIQEVFPELVSEVEGIKAVNYGALIGVLIKAVQELREKIEEK